MSVHFSGQTDGSMRPLLECWPDVERMAELDKEIVEEDRALLRRILLSHARTKHSGVKALPRGRPFKPGHKKLGGVDFESGHKKLGGRTKGTRNRNK